jgi:hypothetical protein
MQAAQDFASSMNCAIVAGQPAQDYAGLAVASVRGTSEFAPLQRPAAKRPASCTVPRCRWQPADGCRHFPLAAAPPAAAPVIITLQPASVPAPAASANATKKSFSVDLQKADGKKNEFPLLGMPADSEWIL